jgi:tripartite-type tricarboxylate transporter receptor subunit TctC
MTSSDRRRFLVGVLVGNPAFPARTLAELVVHVKAHPGEVDVASYSAGTLSQVLACC